MCWAPQRRALFRHLNFQKWSGHGVLCNFSLPHVPRARTACAFSTSQLPKVVRNRRVLQLFTSKCASCHNGVHFFNISTSKSGPRPTFWHFSFPSVLRDTTACTFSFLICPDVSAPAALASLRFNPPEPQTIGKKHSVSRLPYLLAHLHILSSDFLIFSLSELLPGWASSWPWYCWKLSF